MGHAPDFIKVFLSYSHDSEEHAQRVRELSDRLPPEPPAWPAGEEAGAAEAKPRSEETDGQREAQDATPSETAEPSRVGGHYRLARQLGGGGFGRVFAAQDELLNRLVAVKLVPLGGRLAQARDEVLAEAQTPVLGSFGATIRRPIMQSC